MNKASAPSYPASLKFFIDASNNSSYSGSGTNIYDLTTNDNDGVLVNGVGYSSGLLTFNGTNQYIDLDSTMADNTANTANDSFTYLIWFKANSLPAGGANLFGRNSNFPGNQLLRTEGSVIRGGVQDVNNNGNVLTGTTTINTSTYYQACYTYDGTTKTVKLYLNTNLEASGTNSSLNGNLFYSINKVYIGQRNSDLFFNGNIGVAKYYQEARTLTQITEDFNEFKSRYGY
jgi:hypothetical protein